MMIGYKKIFMKENELNNIKLYFVDPKLQGSFKQLIE